LIASSTSARTFTALFVLNALTFAVYGAFVARLRIDRIEARSSAGGYRLSSATARCYGYSRSTPPSSRAPLRC
jgi:hypothetical protein